MQRKSLALVTESTRLVKLLPLAAHALREEADSLAEALAARKLVERAKGLLMEKEKMNERDAYARLRKASQLSGKPIRVVAEALIATFEGS